MGEKYIECCKIHNYLNGKRDGCQGFMSNESGRFCDGCGCHQCFHRKVEVVYTTCKRLHVFGSHLSVDGCQEFIPKEDSAVVCICGCDRAYHRNEITGVTLSSTSSPS